VSQQGISQNIGQYVGQGICPDPGAHDPKATLRGDAVLELAKKRLAEIPEERARLEAELRRLGTEQELLRNMVYGPPQEAKP
jgi:hypothetical protein